ncbi:uncharacterized protein EI90DRAFT_3048668 [Cantharellus anzutake]|uniref:uncharacterized protein n=1 Tax=Cantharellus anzutake TaxID=1750568 RepID=UPI001906F9CA|nr:uncharacterized protein EI90DRAFT_3048668 [Cantharellus anzutake]KAF8334871.1 hypothetical protein EI90DRAFT_3048668 [Cantharellus anzutake]
MEMPHCAICKDDILTFDFSTPPDVPLTQVVSAAVDMCLVWPYAGRSTLDSSSLPG